MNILLKNISSLEKVRSVPELMALNEVNSAKVLAGENYSYQVCGIFTQKPDPNNPYTPYKADTYVFVDSPLKDYINAYCIKDAVADCVVPHDDDVIMTEPGIVPDILVPLEMQNGRMAISNTVTSLWIEVKVPSYMKAGTYPITIRMESNLDRSDILEKSFEIEVLPAKLPSQSTIFTQWLYADCIATAHNVEVYSEEHWELIEKYVKLAREVGINMILTPIITPPLDTETGLKRVCVQLLKIEKCGDKYYFDFSLLDRWIDMCKRCGIEYFEMAHLFSQWGLQYTANIKVKENGVEDYMFDTRVKSTDPEYGNFLRQMLPALVKFLKSKEVFDNCFFHISDEPYDGHLEAYQFGRDVLAPIVGEERMMDAMSRVEYYDRGLTKLPVVSINHMPDFLSRDIENRWGYYCCSQWDKVSNNFLAMPGYRNRIIGLQIYKFNLVGFLNWGFNYYNSQVSRYLINPYMTSSADKAFPSGDAFRVYPMEKGPVSSMRAIIFKEALQDVDVCKTLEKYIGKEAVIKMIDEEAGMNVTFFDYPRNSDYIPSLMNKMKEMIADHEAK